MPPEGRQRLLDLLSYVGAMIYHERSENEQPELQQVVEDSVPIEQLRQEFGQMKKTMADVLTEKGRREAAIETRQKTLVRQLGRRFGNVPVSVVTAVESTTDVAQLDDWLDRLVNAATMEELQIPAGDG